MTNLLDRSSMSTSPGRSEPEATDGDGSMNPPTSGNTTQTDIVIACDKFKGTLSSAQVRDRVAEGIRQIVRDRRHISTVPVADGGDGTLQALIESGWEHRPVRVSGPTGAPVDSGYVVRGARAVVELADACGLGRLPGGRLAPLTASTRGLGEMLSAALDAGYRDLVVGVGGSASTDGGAGMLSALGIVPKDRAGRRAAPGAEGLLSVTDLDTSSAHPALRQSAFTLASDVRNPLLGKEGAVAVFGPQKGVSTALAPAVENGLTRWADLLARVTGKDERDSPAAGAAGGVGLACLAALGAELRSGIDFVLDEVGFQSALARAALVVTGEGRLDSQSLSGKVPIGVARAAVAHAVPVVAVCGQSQVDPDLARSHGIDRVFALTDIQPDPEICRAEAGPLLTALSARAAIELEL